MQSKRVRPFIYLTMSGTCKANRETKRKWQKSGDLVLTCARLPSLEPVHSSADYEHVDLRVRPCLNINIILTTIDGSCPGSLAAPYSVLSWDIPTPQSDAPKSCVYKLLEHLTGIELLEAIKWLAPTITLSRVLYFYQRWVSSHLFLSITSARASLPVLSTISTLCCYSAGPQDSG